MLVGLNEAGRLCGPEARVSVGRLLTDTDGPSTIVGQCNFVIDIRHPDAGVLARLSDRCIAVCQDIAATADCSVALTERFSIPPRLFDETCVSALERAAAALSLRHVRMASGALHDASNIALIAPTAMVFVPCWGGISHNVKEYAAPEDLAAGASVLLHAMLEKAGTAPG